MFSNVMVTGHRPFGVTDEQRNYYIDRLPKIARSLQKDFGMKRMISGMAIGVDTVWAECAIALGVPLSAYIPFPQQSDRWGYSDRQKWNKLREQADEEVMIGDKFSIRLLHARNDAMIRASNLAVAAWAPSQTTGGTASAVGKIRRVNKPLILIDLDAFTVSRENF